jgi:hypothetical protein
MNTAGDLSEARKLTILYWARFTISDLQDSIRKHRIGRTHSLISSLNYSYHHEGDGDGTVNIEFNFYGKFLDMQVGRGRKIEDISQNRLIYKALGQKNKNTKWLSKPVYTQISALKHILAEKFGEDAANIIRERISNNINISL